MDHSGYEDQKEHFDLASHQYPRDAILNPPLHTELEIQGVMNALGGIPAGSHVVDFGAGTGRLSVALAKSGYPVLAVDISDASLATLRDLAEVLDLPSIQTSTTFPDSGPFAAVVGADVLHHVDLDDYLPNLQAVLAEGGKAVFTEPGGMNPIWYAYLSIFYDMKVERRIVHCNLATLRRKFERHGFRDVKISGVGLLPRPLFGWSNAACRLHDRSSNLPILRWVAYRYLIEATKPA
ncbi:MAG: class I SAM-dependent methyltransferase [Chloroflexia bacterium]|nr:class I SAM-dependent methyltransferase [Chloroflexia bacterium]